jgi:hypothetical protein
VGLAATSPALDVIASKRYVYTDELANHADPAG